MATIPTNYADRAQLGIKVARNWQNNFATYTTKFTTATDLLQISENLALVASNAKQADAKKRVSSVKLKTINKMINDSLAKLKLNIQHATNTTDATYFMQYGIQKISKAYLFPRDNDARVQALKILIQKLREPSNIVAQQIEGLNFWEDLATRHAEEWELTGFINSDKSSASGSAKNAFKECGDLLVKIKAQIKLDFPKNEVATVLRAIGFQEESY